jgi:hypothetical protein
MMFRIIYIFGNKGRMKKCIAVMAFAVIFLAAVFLFMRNYPSDRWFSGVFIVAGGVMAWCVWGAEAENKIECCYDKPVSATVTDATNEHDEHGSIAGNDSEDGIGNGKCERKSDDGDTN